jgi:hypothetical protein
VGERLEIVWHHGWRVQNDFALVRTPIVAGVDAGAERHRDQPVEVETPIARVLRRLAEGRRHAAGQRRGLRLRRIHAERHLARSGFLSLSRECNEAERERERKQRARPSVLVKLLL